MLVTARGPPQAGQGAPSRNAFVGERLEPGAGPGGTGPASIQRISHQV
jgi:hypothetical protein